HGNRAVGLVTDVRGETFAHLALHHHEHVLDGRHLLEQVEHERGGDVVRQVGHESPTVVTEQLPPVDAAGVALDDRDARGLDDLPARESHATIAYRWARSKTRSVLAQVAASTSATSTPRAAATADPTIGTSAGRFCSPR